MEILVKKTTEEKVEIKLPYYCKSSCFAFSVLNEDQAIQVFYSVYNSATIGTVHAGLAFSTSLGCTPCTKEEFNSMYIAASGKLQDMINLTSLPEIQY